MTDMVEVFSIRVFSNKSEDGSINGGELYGAVMSEDWCGTSVFFKQGGGSSDDSILPDGTLSLNGPLRCNLGEFWGIRLKLYLKKNHEDFELCNGFLVINPISSERYHNKPMSGFVSGKDGYALVNLVTLSCAIQATVEVSVVDSAGQAFYGHIRAQHRNKLYEHRNFNELKYFQTTMFSASQERACYTKGDKIPLSRHVTAVQIWSDLVIEARLFEEMNNQSPVADGSLTFKAKPCGVETKMIGRIQVKVTWTEHDYLHSNRGESCNLECSPA